MSTHTYTSAAEMERLFSDIALDERIDLTGVGASEDTVLNDMINDATSTIDAYIAKYYAPASVTNNQWVRRRATVFACHYLSQRRGNPALFTQWFDRILGELEKVAEGKLLIPGAASYGDGIPAVTNYYMDSSFGGQKARVDIGNSSEGSYPGQPTGGLPDIMFP